MIEQAKTVPAAAETDFCIEKPTFSSAQKSFPDLKNFETILDENLTLKVPTRGKGKKKLFKKTS